MNCFSTLLDEWVNEISEQWRAKYKINPMPTLNTSKTYRGSLIRCPLWVMLRFHKRLKGRGLIINLWMVFKSLFIPRPPLPKQLPLKCDSPFSPALFLWGIASTLEIAGLSPERFLRCRCFERSDIITNCPLSIVLQVKNCRNREICSLTLQVRDDSRSPDWLHSVWPCPVKAPIATRLANCFTQEWTSHSS